MSHCRDSHIFETVSFQRQRLDESRFSTIQSKAKEGIVMTHAERNEAIRLAAEQYTAKNLESKTRTREALYKTGMYTKRGELKVAAGGKRD
jgi:hypothetical protein